MEKLRRLFISSFRWRLLINIIVSYIITFLVYSSMIIILASFDIFSLSIEIKYFISFVLSLCVFLIIFFAPGTGGSRRSAAPPHWEPGLR